MRPPHPRSSPKRRRQRPRPSSPKRHPRASDPNMLKAGDSFERYTIEAPIGQGGMGVVYRAHDTRLGRRVALKVISDRVAGNEASARLVREARAAAALDHP